MMNESVQIIPLSNLLIVFIPVAIVLVIYLNWSLNIKEAGYSLTRMLLQLSIIGYLLGVIFDIGNGWVLLLVITIMLFASGWIALRTVEKLRVELLGRALIAIIVGSVSILLLIMLGVLDLEPWYSSQYMIPLAGMIFANSMNCISLSIDRLVSELKRDVGYIEARNAAFQAALIPIVNSLFAVGLVTLPGMMTGQILSGVDPLIAARYQIMVMCMIFGSAGITTAFFLKIVEKKLSSRYS